MAQGIPIQTLLSKAPKAATVHFPDVVTLYHGIGNLQPIGTASKAGAVYKYKFPADFEEAASIKNHEILATFSPLQGEGTNSETELKSLHVYFERS